MGLNGDPRACFPLLHRHPSKCPLLSVLSCSLMGPGLGPSHHCCIGKPGPNQEPQILGPKVWVSAHTLKTQDPRLRLPTHIVTHSYGSKSPQIHRLEPKAQGVSTRPSLILKQRSYKMRRPSFLPLCCLRASGSLAPSHMLTQKRRLCGRLSPHHTLQGHPNHGKSIAQSTAVNNGPCPPPACGGLDTRFRPMVLRF